jgi:DNA (cytosine-5)-methyltransferase 1
MSAYYNEIDPYAAQWLRNLIAAGHIAPGDVDERSIVDVRPDDLRSYTQCHFFAGIGGWSRALRLAGRADDEPIWTGSCPCPPFSAAGKRISCPTCASRLLVWCPRRTGFAICADCGHAWFADARHLWPEFWRLIAERRPARVFGEQVASEEGLVWLAAVRGSLEIIRYDLGASDLPACGVGAPHIRQRLWWVANPLCAASERRAGSVLGAQAPSNRAWIVNGRSSDGSGDVAGIEAQGIECQPHAQQRVAISGLGDAQRRGPPGGRQRSGAPEASLSASTSWACDWLPCSDGKARPVEPGTFPLAHGIPGRVGRLRAYGNAIVPQVAAEFIKASQYTSI